MDATTLKNGPYEARLIYGQGSSDVVLKNNPGITYDCVVTSPPYFNLRNYSEEENEIGKDQTLDEYIQGLVRVFRSVRENLSDDGTVFPYFVFFFAVVAQVEIRWGCNNTIVSNAWVIFENNIT